MKNPFSRRYFRPLRLPDDLITAWRDGKIEPVELLDRFPPTPPVPIAMPPIRGPRMPGATNLRYDTEAEIAQEHLTRQVTDDFHGCMADWTCERHAYSGRPPCPTCDNPPRVKKDHDEIWAEATHRCPKCRGYYSLKQSPFGVCGPCGDVPLERIDATPRTPAMSDPAGHEGRGGVATRRAPWNGPRTVWRWSYVRNGWLPTGSMAAPKP